MSDFQIISKNNEHFVVDWDVIERLLKSIYTTQDLCHPVSAHQFHHKSDETIR
jgi:hypothetical protein